MSKQTIGQNKGVDMVTIKDNKQATVNMKGTLTKGLVPTPDCGNQVDATSRLPAVNLLEPEFMNPGADKHREANRR